MKKLALVLTVLLGGCASYQSEIRLPGGTSFVLPKDAQFSYMKVEVPFIYTNGLVATAELVISNGVFKMNPAVLDAATAHDVAIIQTTTAAFGTVVGTAAKTAK